MESELEEGMLATPVASRSTTWDDSGYLTNTPESAYSVRFMNHCNQVTGQLAFMKFTPASSSSKPVEYIPFDRNKPFPISTEDSEVIDVLEEPVICVNDTESAMCIDSVGCTQDDGIYSPDISDRSLYDTVQLQHSKLFDHQGKVNKHCGMEIDEDIQFPHPNSDNEDWNDLKDTQPYKFVEEFCTPSLSLETPSGQNLLVQKLQDLKTCQKKTPSWRLMLKQIGCKYADDFSGKSTVDFMLYLGVHSDHSQVISNILSYLSPSDLKACSNVSKLWREVCAKDRNSVIRLERYKQQKSYVNKENWIKNKLNTGVHQFGPLATISNFQHTRVSPPPTPIVSPRKVRTREYVDALNIEDVMFMQCPKCRFPAKIDKAIFEARCDKQNCQYLFCTKCHFQAHRPKRCVTVSGRKIRKRGASTVGSKESRKNLRRLL